MTKVIIERNLDKYVVSKAIAYDPRRIVCYTTKERGFNLFGEPLEPVEMPVYSVPIYVPGEALSQAFDTEEQARAYITTIGAERVGLWQQVQSPTGKAAQDRAK